MCYWVTLANAVHNIPAETDGVLWREDAFMYRNNKDFKNEALDKAIAVA